MQRIVDQRFNDLFCSSNALCLDIGDNYADEDGDPMPAYSFLVIGPCRFTRGGTVLLSATKLYAEHGNNGLACTQDARLVAVKEALVGSFVESASLSQDGDLFVAFSCGICFTFCGAQGGSFALYKHHENGPCISYGNDF